MPNKYDAETAKKVLARALPVATEAYRRAVEVFFSEVQGAVGSMSQVTVRRCSRDNRDALDVQTLGRTVELNQSEPHILVSQGQATVLTLAYDPGRDRFALYRDDDDDDGTDGLVALAAACAGRDAP
jgi:hypothetical protein